jgi:hypothetical protein
MSNETNLLHLKTDDKKTNLTYIPHNSSKLFQMFHERSRISHNKTNEVKHDKKFKTAPDKHYSGQVPFLNCHAKPKRKPQVNVKTAHP